MMSRTKLSVFVLGLLAATSMALCAQQTEQPSQYQGVSHPPADEVIETSTIPEAKPPAGKPLVEQSAPAAPQSAAQPVAPPAMPVAPMDGTRMSSGAPGTAYLPPAQGGLDDDIVHVGHAQPASMPQVLNARTSAYDPDGDIVHPRPMRAGELREGTAIRVHLMDRLSTAETEKGEPFHTRVATDVTQGGQVVIPAGSEIDGRVVEVSTGHVAGHGTMRLAPDTVILPNGTRYRLHALLTSTPGSDTRVRGEGEVQPASRLKRDGIEYGGAVGAGAVTGAIVAGPVGALTGSLIGAGAITVHLLVSHPQATLDSGTTLMFMLTDSLYLAPDTVSGN